MNSPGPLVIKSQVKYMFNIDQRHKEIQASIYFRSQRRGVDLQVG